MPLWTSHLVVHSSPSASASPPPNFAPRRRAPVPAQGELHYVPVKGFIEELQLRSKGSARLTLRVISIGDLKPGKRPAGLYRQGQRDRRSDPQSGRAQGPSPHCRYRHRPVHSARDAGDRRPAHAQGRRRPCVLVSKTFRMPRDGRRTTRALPLGGCLTTARRLRCPPSGKALSMATTATRP
jgi:hypothetical protein